MMRLIVIILAKHIFDLLYVIVHFHNRRLISSRIPELLPSPRHILEVDFGTYAYHPFVRILAPIDPKISESDIKDNKLTFLLTASDLVRLKDIRVALQGYNDKGQTTDFSRNVRDFKRVGRQQVFQPISIELPAHSLYIKMVLYYKHK